MVYIWNEANKKNEYSKLVASNLHRILNTWLQQAVLLNTQ